MAEPAKNLETTPEPATADEDPVLRALENAPFDDEPETEEERAAVAEAWEDVRAGRLIPHEEVAKRWLGKP
jgi:predicted transcriptional regulator